MKVLVTGGAGFIGSHLVDKLIDNGHKVLILDDLSGGTEDNLNPEVEFIACDLRNEKEAASYIRWWGPELVYHLAANAAENKAQFSPIDITSRNWNTFINVLVPALRSGMRRIVVTSSIAVYGQGQTPFKETDKPEPEDLYGLSKLMMEESLKVLSKVHNFEYVITRPHNVYGPRQNMTDPYRNVVTIFMNALLKNEPFYIYGDGEQKRCFSYIDDVVNALYLTGFQDVNGKTFNVGSDRSYTLNQLGGVIQEVAGTDIDPIHLADRPQEVKVAISDHTEAIEQGIWTHQETTLKDGLEQTWIWAKEQGPQQPIYTELELPSNKVPENWKNEKNK
jgi:UDP-glucose 4-epimerase